MATKAHILQEIKRTAEANGGRPLGFRRFETETGIKEYDWLGKHWARWSDALREAGYVPNRLQDAYDTTELLDKYAKVAQEFGRLPTNADLRLKAHGDSGFPDAKTFQRFGTKSKIVEQLINYCQSHEGYENVVRLCEEYTARNQGISPQSVHRDEEIGFVYLNKVRSQGRWLYYIGRTDSLGRRENEHYRKFQSMKPIHAIPTPHPPAAEKYWYARFAAKRVHHSIFDLDKKDITAFRKCKSM